LHYADFLARDGFNAGSGAFSVDSKNGKTEREIRMRVQEICASGAAHIIKVGTL